MLLDFARQNLKLLVAGVMRRKIAAERKILFRLRGPEPKDLIEVGNHGFRIRPRCGGGKRLARVEPGRAGSTRR